ncbi:MAG: hypothetical protein IT258_13790 [Saprospiraceae bacterium]|nr:hypothetical protein [Saprospiraceae bacterium]
MKKAFAISIFVLVALFFSCKSNDDVKLPDCPNCNFTCLAEGESDVSTNECPNNWQCQFNLLKDSKIEYANDEHSGSASIKEGDKLVFELTLETEGSAMVADDELKKSLYFEVDALQESFSVEGDDLNLLNLRYQNACYCFDTRFNQPSSGCMQGQKIDETHWRVQGNLEIPLNNSSLPFKFDATFTL